MECRSFNSLPFQIDDQICLLINSWCELLLFSCCYRSVTTPGEIRISLGKSITLAQAKSSGMQTCIERMLNLTDHMRRLRLDRYEYVAMKVIVLLQSGGWRRGGFVVIEGELMEIGNSPSRHVRTEGTGEGANESGEGAARVAVVYVKSLPGHAGQVWRVVAEDTRVAEDVSGEMEMSGGGGNIEREELMLFLSGRQRDVDDSKQRRGGV